MLIAVHVQSFSHTQPCRNGGLISNHSCWVTWCYSALQHSQLEELYESQKGYPAGSCVHTLLGCGLPVWMETRNDRRAHTPRPQKQNMLIFVNVSLSLPSYTLFLLSLSPLCPVSSTPSSFLILSLPLSSPLSSLFLSSLFLSLSLFSLFLSFFVLPYSISSPALPLPPTSLLM